MPSTLYDRLGGQEAVSAAVDLFYARLMDDPSLRPYFARTELRAQRAHMRGFLATALGGPAIYAGRDMRSAHAGLAIDDRAFDRVVDHLAWTLAALGIDDELIAEVAGHLAPLRAQVVDAELPRAA